MTLDQVKLIPYPRRIIPGTEVLHLRRALDVRTVDRLPWQGSEFPSRLEAALGSAGVKVKFFELDQYEEQSYKIEIGRGGIIVCGRGMRGLMYGAETLRQVLSQCGKEVPCGVIEDGPRMPWRGVWLDLRMHKYKPAFLKALCSELARLKYTALVVHYHDGFPFKKEPCLRGEVYYTLEQVHDLQKVGRDVGIEVVPYVSVMGAVDYIVDLERYRGLRASDGTVDVRNPRSLKLMCSVLDEVMAVHEAQMVGVGVAAPLAGGVVVDEVGREYLLGLVEHAMKRGKSALVCAGGELRDEGWLARVPKNALVAQVAGEREGLQRVAEACGRHELRVVGLLSGRGPSDGEWCHDSAAAVRGLEAGVENMRAAGVTRGLVAVPSGCACILPTRPAPSRLCGTRMMHVSMTMPTLGAAAELLWGEGADARRVGASWPQYWWGADDTRYNDLASGLTTNPFHGGHLAEIVKRCKRAIKLVEELKPPRHAEELPLYGLYARLVLHAVHVQQAFAHAPRGQQLGLLQTELERLQDVVKDVLSATLYRHEVQEEQAHLFGHTAMLLARVKNAAGT